MPGAAKADRWWRDPHFIHSPLSDQARAISFYGEQVLPHLPITPLVTIVARFPLAS